MLVPTKTIYKNKPGQIDNNFLNGQTISLEYPIKRKSSCTNRDRLIYSYICREGFTHTQWLDPKYLNIIDNNEVIIVKD